MSSYHMEEDAVAIPLLPGATPAMALEQLKNSGLGVRRFRRVPNLTKQTMWTDNVTNHAARPVKIVGIPRANTPPECWK